MKGQAISVSSQGQTSSNKASGPSDQRGVSRVGGPGTGIDAREDGVQRTRAKQEQQDERVANARRGCRNKVGKHSPRRRRGRLSGCDRASACGLAAPTPCRTAACPPDVSARHSSAKLRKRAGLLTPFPQPPRRALWPWLGSRAAGLCRRVSVSDSSPRMAVLLAGMGAHPRRSHGRRPAHTAHATLSASESATAGSRLTILTLRQRSRGRDATSMVPAISTNDEMVMMIVVLVLVRMMI
eukprot:2650144-Rhodomonas_salina.2